MRRSTGFALSAAFLASVLSCSKPAPDRQGGQEGGSGPRVAAVRVDRVVGDSTHLQLPVARYLWTEQETRLLGRAETALLSACVQRYRLRLPPTPAVSNVAPASETARRYGLTSPTEAGTAGYRLPAALKAGQPAPTFPQMSPQLIAALNGAPSGSDVVNGKQVPAGGCITEARTKLARGHVLGVSDIAQQINNRSWQLSRTHPQVRRAFRAWASCMATAGYTYGDPMSPMNDRRFQGVPSAKEIATATADVTCKRRSNVTGVWYAVDVAYQKALIAQAGASLRQAAADKTSELQAAHRIILSNS